MPAIAALIGGNHSARIFKIAFALYISSAVLMININLVAFKAHLAKAQRDIALAVHLHLIKMHLSCVAGDGEHGIMSGELHKNVPLQIIYAGERIKGALIAGNGGLHCAAQGR